MSKQAHFVVYVDLETEQWFVDDETLMVKFDDGATWNSTTSEWEDTDDDDNIAALSILHQLKPNDTERLLKVSELLEQSEVNEAYTELMEFLAERGFDENRAERTFN